MKNKLIGRVIATEKNPTTMDKFTFWTDSNLKLHAFDIVKVGHIDGSFSYGVIENISHIADTQSFLTSFILIFLVYWNLPRVFHEFLNLQK